MFGHVIRCIVVIITQVHAYIIAELKSQMPSMFGKDKKKEQLISKLVDVFRKIQAEHNISPGDFPSVSKFQEQLRQHDFSKFNSLRPKLIQHLDRMLANDIPRLMAMIPQEQIDEAVNKPSVTGGAFSVSHATNNPFSQGACEGTDIGKDSEHWIVLDFKAEYDKMFQALQPSESGKITGVKAKREMQKSKLPNTALGHIWKLSDIDRDGCLDEDEFALTMYLIKLKLEGSDLPDILPSHLIPPSKKDLVAE